MPTVSASDPRIQYTGRIDLSDSATPQFFYAGSYATLRFTGTTLQATFSDEGGWNEHANQIGCVVDNGELTLHPLVKATAQQTIPLATGLADSSHTAIVIKLNGPGDGRGRVILHSLALDAGKNLLPHRPCPPARSKSTAIRSPKAAARPAPKGQMIAAHTVTVAGFRTPTCWHAISIVRFTTSASAGWLHAMAPAGTKAVTPASKPPTTS